MSTLKKSFFPEKIVIGTIAISCAAIAFRSVRLIGIAAALLCRRLNKETPDGK